MHSWNEWPKRCFRASTDADERESTILHASRASRPVARAGQADLRDSGPAIIDVNPRLVEPANALAAGVDLVAAMLDVAGGGPAQERSSGRAGVRTRQTLVAILGGAAQQGARGAVLREAFDAIFARGDYAGSVEELTPVAGDPVAAVPVLAAFVASLIHPPLWQKFHTGAVGPRWMVIAT